MPGTVTLTGPSGPAKTMTAQQFVGVSNVNIDLDRKVLQITLGPTSLAPGRVQEMDIAATTTLTDTITSGNHVIVVSQ